MTILIFIEFTWGTVPVLELSDHPGQMISQSMAIARFLAKRFHLVGGVCVIETEYLLSRKYLNKKKSISDNDFESAKCDELCDALKDYVSGTFHFSRFPKFKISKFPIIIACSLQQPGLAFCTKPIR